MCLKKIIRKKMRYIRKREVLQSTCSYTAARFFFNNVNLKKIKVIGVYWPILYEIDTRPLIKALSIRKKVLALPSIEKNVMIFKKWKTNEPLFLNAEKFYAPKNDVMQIVPDILLVPLLAFDSCGNRLGYGKGYYDKYYENNKEANYYGYGYDAQFYKKLPCEKHDMKLDYVITEKKIYKFS